MTDQLAEYEEYLNRELTRLEIRKYEAYQRKRRRTLWLQRNEYLIVGVVSIAVSVAAFYLLWRLP